MRPLAPLRHGVGPGSGYEFRIFGASLRPLPSVLAAIAGTGTFEASVDRYVVVGDIVATSLKLRRGALELKTLRGTCGNLELWEATSRLDLPAAGGEVAGLLRPAGIDLQLRDGADAEELVARLSRQPGVAIVTVRKRRRNFVLDGARAEVTEVLADGMPLESLAMESEDPRMLGAVVGRLGLRDAENTSYPSLLLALARSEERTPRLTATERRFTSDKKSSL